MRRDLREIEEHVLANGRVDGHELETLRQALYGDRKIYRQPPEQHTSGG
jgi:hypothetical protein